jgi:putative SOS response-associated peptidase YedK
MAISQVFKNVYDDWMCGRYSIVRGDKIVLVIPNVTMPVNLRLVGRYNAAPTQLLPVITNQSNEVQMIRWGLIPSWTKNATVRLKLSEDKLVVSLELIPVINEDIKKSHTIINARAETLAEKPAFRKALASRRCLIPADGFYEWRKEADGKTKTPMYIRMRDRDIFAFAGLWETWNDPGGKEVKSFTIITTAPNDLLKTIHDRMPAIIPREGYLDWLKQEAMSADEAAAWLRPFPAESMETYPVRPLVNSPKNEGDDFISPAEKQLLSPKSGEQQFDLFST